MRSTHWRELPASPISHSAGAGFFDSANTSLREVLAALRMTLRLGACTPFGYEERTRNGYNHRPSATCLAAFARMGGAAIASGLFAS